MSWAWALLAWIDEIHLGGKKNGDGSISVSAEVKTMPVTEIPFRRDLLEEHRASLLDHRAGGFVTPDKWEVEDE